MIITFIANLVFFSREPEFREHHAGKQVLRSYAEQRTKTIIHRSFTEKIVVPWLHYSLLPCESSHLSRSKKCLHVDENPAEKFSDDEHFKMTVIKCLTSTTRFPSPIFLLKFT